MRKAGAKLAFGALLTGAWVGTGCGSSDRDYNNVTLSPTSTSTALSPPTTVTTPGVAPTASNDSYGVVGNGVLVVAAAQGVLANDQAQGAAATLQSGPSRGQLTLNADGSFTYTPNQGVGNTTDSFTYSLTNASGTSTGTVTITIGSLAFFVNNQAAAGGNGQQATPFNTLAAAVAAANGVAGAQLVVEAGDGTSNGYNTSVTLGAGQALVGASASARPTLTGPVTLSSGNRVQDLRLVNTSGNAVDGTNATDGTVVDVSVVNATNKGVALLGSTGSWTIQNSTFDTVANGTIDAITSSGSLTFAVTNCTFANDGLSGVFGNPTGTATQSMTVTNCTFNGGANQKIDVVANTSGTMMTLNFQNNTVNGGGVAGRGIDVTSQGSTQLLARVLGNQISGCTADGLFVTIAENSLAKMRFQNNQTTGNQAGSGWRNAVAPSSTLQAIYQGNNSDDYIFNNGSTWQVEDFADFNSNNTGTVHNNGTPIQNAPSGSLGIP